MAKLHVNTDAKGPGSARTGQERTGRNPQAAGALCAPRSNSENTEASVMVAAAGDS